MYMCAHWGEWIRTAMATSFPHLPADVQCALFVQVLDMWGTVMLTKEDTNAYGLGWAWTGELLGGWQDESQPAGLAVAV